MMFREKPPGHTSESVLNSRLVEAMDAYLSELDRGGKPVISEFKTRYSDVANQLEEMLPGLEFLGIASADLKPTETSESDDVRPIGTIGDYRIMREIGRGGMGVVYEAEQLSIGRAVALKVLPFAAVLDHQAITRFKNEARAAGSLTHPNIVQVYGVGHERGVYHYAMALIHGLTLAEVLQVLKRRVLSSKGHDTDRLSLVDIVEQHGSSGGGAAVSSGQFDPTIDTAEMPETVQVDEPTAKELQAAISTHRSMFGRDYQRQVTRIGTEAADALHYAHENGIVHRDIKPGNLMVDTDGKLWITDFGLARIESDIGMTRSGDLLGTLRYMAPEQALGKRIIVDHRADIYSLGATLYELLALRPVFDGTTRETLLKQLTFEEPKPLRHVCPTASTDLETIVMKAIANNPDERYASAGEMADDLRALKENRPIKAKPATLWVRGKKWVGRNQGLVTATVVILLIATIGLGVSNLLIAQQRDAAQEAKEEESIQRAEAERQRTIAQENFERARDAVDEYLTRVSEEVLLDEPGMQPLRKDLLELALNYYEEFAKERRNDDSLQTELALAYIRVGEIKETLGLFEESISAYKQAIAVQESVLAKNELDQNGRSTLASAYRQLGEVYQANLEFMQAKEFCKKAIDLLVELTREAPDSTKFQLGLTYAFASMAQSQAMLDGYQRLVTEFSPIELDIDSAVENYQDAITIQERLLQNDPDNKEIQTALTAMRGQLANLYARVGKTNEGVDLIQQNHDLLKQHLDENPSNTSDQSNWSAHLNNYAMALSKIGENEKAFQFFNESLELIQKLATENPHVTRFASGYANAKANYAIHLRNRGRFKEAVEFTEGALSEWNKLVARYPEYSPAKHGLAVEHCHYAQLHSAMNKPMLANDQMAISLDLFNELVLAFPRNKLHQYSLFSIMHQLSLSHEKTGDAEKATKRIANIVNTFRLRARNAPDRHEYREVLAEALHRLGIHYRNIGSGQESKAAILEAIDLQKGLVEFDQENIAWRADLVRRQDNLARTMIELGEKDEAIGRIRDVVELYAELVAETPGEADFREKLNSSLGLLAFTLSENGQSEESIEVYRELHDSWGILVSENANIPDFRLSQANSASWLGSALFDSGRTEEALENLRKSVSIMQGLADENAQSYRYRIQLILRLATLSLNLRDLERIDEANSVDQEIVDLIRKQPPNGRTAVDWGYLGQTLVRMEKWLEAKEAFQKGMELRGDKSPTLFNGPRWVKLAVILVHLGEMGKAREYYDILVKEFAENAPRYDYAKDGLEELATLLGIDPEPDQPPRADTPDDDVKQQSPETESVKEESSPE